MIRLRRFNNRGIIRSYFTAKIIYRSRSHISKFRDELRKRTNNNEAALNSSKERLDPQQATKLILQKNKSKANTTYFDPANSSLNLSLDNQTLYKEIYNNAVNRMNKRYTSPSDMWLRDFQSLIKRIPESKIGQGSKNQSKELFVKQHLIDCIQIAKISPEKASQPISVGDLVALNDDSVNLYIIAACPTDFDSSSYTFINNEGEIIYGPKQLIKLRIPGVIPDHLIEIIKSFVQLEKKYLNIAPIGISDAIFSRSDESLPSELKSTLKTTKTYENQGDMSTSDIEDDFIVAQASSQLLTNSNVNTHHVPIKARELYSKGLLYLSIKSFEKLPIISKKLEILHRVLQFDEDGDSLDSPRTISIFQLLNYLEKFNLNTIPNDDPDLIDYRRIRTQLSESFLNESEESNLGKLLPEPTAWSNFNDDSYSISSFLALILSLRKQGKLWNINQKNSSDPPISVDILPVKNLELISNILNYLKFNNGDIKFTKFFIKKIKGEDLKEKPKYYDEIIQLFKDYISGNISNDPQVETTLVTIIRLIDKLLIKENLRSDNYISYSYDYSKARAFDILQMLNDSFKSESSMLENPFQWSYSLQLPNVSIMSNLSKDYYDYLDSNFSEENFNDGLHDSSKFRINNITSLDSFNQSIESKPNQLPDDFYCSDPLKVIREDFKDIPIYCIDSEFAHEIDDGISIHPNNNKYIISIHIANPTSYVKPFSTVSKIAFSKGSTVYMPEGPIMMLPNLISKIAGLGNNDRQTRTFVIQFELDKQLIDDYISKRNNDENHKPSNELSKEILKQIEDSSNIKLGKAKKFPKNFTYHKVNEILNDSENIENFKNNKLVDEDISNLFKLYNISTILKDIRVIIGNGLDINSQKSSIQVEYGDKNDVETFKEDESGYELNLPGEKKAPVIKIINNKDQDVNSQSQLLVSHFMIFANYSSSIFAKKNRIPIIYRCQEMNLDENIIMKLKELSKQTYIKNNELSVGDINKIISVLTSAQFQTNSKRHESLGLNSYTTVTSPLRRYVDMINHWKFEEFLLKKQINTIKDHQLYFISSHLQNCELINKKIQQFSNKFWEGIFLKQYIKLLNQGKISIPIKFKLLIKNNPQFGSVPVNVCGFNNLRARLENNSKLINKFRAGEIKIGSVLESDNINITKIDFIEDELVFEFN